MQTNSLPTIAWTRLLGTKSTGENTSITTGLDGSIYVSDSISASLDGQTFNGASDVFITKYSQDGNKVWTRLLGGASGDFSSALTVGLDGSIYVGGRTDWMIDGQTNNGRSDAFISKYNYDGTKVWTRLVGTTEVEYGVSLTTGNDGAIYLAGSSTGSLDGQSNNGFGTFDAFITKYNPDGTKVWTRMLGSRLDEYARAVTTGLDGSIYLCGSTGGSIDGQIHNTGDTDAFITKYTPDGTKVWTRLLGGSGYANALAISSSADGSIYISGEGAGPLDGQGNSFAWNAFITKYDQDGNKIWTRRIGEGTRAKALTTDLDGSIYVSGWTQGALDGQAFSGNADAFISKYNSDGVKIWTRLFGTNTTEVSTSLTRGVDGSIYLAGSTTGSVDGRETITGGTDAFIIKLVDLDTTSPTIAISSNNTTHEVDVTSEIFFTLSESSENFTASDVSVTGGTLSNFSGSGKSYSALFKPNPNRTSNGVVFVESGVFADAAGNANATPVTFSIPVITVITDTSAPSVIKFSPSDEATGVAISAKIVVTFNEAVQLGTGTIVLKTGAGLTVATFDTVTSTNLSISGNTLTISPASNLNYNTYYKLEFSANTIKDISGNSFTGASSYNFTTAANTAPVAIPTIETTKEDTESIGRLTGTDADGNVMTFTKVTDPNYGIVTINTSTGAYTYTPTGNFNGTDSFTFKVNDGIFDSIAATVSLTISAVNDPPIAIAFSTTTNEDAVKTGRLTGTDVDRNLLKFAKVTDPNYGIVTVNTSTGAYTYTPTANFNGTDLFTFKVNDGTVDSAVATVSITVVAVNDTPIATAASATMNEDTAKIGTLAGTDIDGNTLTFVKVADPSHGTVTVNTTTGAYTYTPILNFNGSDSFTFKVNDGTVDSAVATVLLTVTAVNDSQTGAVTISGTATQGQTLTAANTLADADGMGTISYQWKTDGVNISGATSSTLTLTQAEVGKAITVVASYTDLGNTAESVTSNATSAIANVNDAPTGTVSISGTATQGQVLTAANTLADADGLGTISYQWKADGVNISGATSSTLTLAQAQVGKAISVTASYTDLGSTAESVTSSATSSVVNVNDAPSGSVTISGATKQGEALTAANSLADADGLGTISYQWKADGVNISGATSSTLTLSQAQVGKAISVAAIYTDGGNTAESVVSTATASVQALATGSNLTGQIYQWKSHTLLSGAEISLAGLSSPVLPNNAKHLYELKNIEHNSATGVVQVGLWMNLNASIKNFDLNLKNEEGQALSFTASTTVFPTGWAVQANPDSTGGLSVAGFGDTAMTSTSVQLGTVSFKLNSGSKNTQINFLEGSVGGVTEVKQQTLTPYAANVKQELSVTGADGKYTINSLDATTYSLDASKSLTALETGSAISSADALAALKIAVGRNPNLDGMAVSPYQLIAADVNQDGKVTSADALAILKMAVKRTDAPTREWLFVNESQDFWDEAANGGQGGLTISRTNVTWNKDLQATVSKDTTVNLLAVLKGDVNGSWIGASGTQSLPNSYFTDLVAKGLGPLSTWAVVMA
jgi:methionine-rich copper-binding protein CopC